METPGTTTTANAVTELAARLYAAYCADVGGVAHDGRPLPTWEEFSADHTRSKQRSGWIACALIAQREAVDAIRPGGWDYFSEQINAAERRANNAVWVAQQAQEKVRQLEAAQADHLMQLRTAIRELVIGVEFMRAACEHAQAKTNEDSDRLTRAQCVGTVINGKYGELLPDYQRDSFWAAVRSLPERIGLFGRTFTPSTPPATSNA